MSCDNFRRNYTNPVSSSPHPLTPRSPLSSSGSMSSVPTVSELEQTFGVILIGYVVAMVAFGITVFQTYVYYLKYALDSIWTKTVVGSLCFLDVVMTILVSHAIYHYMVLQYPFTTGLIDATPTYSAQMALSVVALFIVQLFYAFHTWRASKNMIISMFITSTSLAAFVLGLVVAANLVRDSAFSSLTEGSSKVIMITSKSLVCFSGLFTAGVLSYYLRPSTNPSAPVIKDFDDQIVNYLVSHGTLAAAFQLSFVVMLAASPSKPLWMPFQFLASKVYTNSLLTLLNSRKSRHGKVIEGGLDSARTVAANFPTHRTSNVCFNVVDSRLDEHGQGIGTSRTNSDTFKKSIIDEDYKQCWQDEIVEHKTPSVSTDA